MPTHAGRPTPPAGLPRQRRRALAHLLGLATLGGFARHASAQTTMSPSTPDPAAPGPSAVPAPTAPSAPAAPTAPSAPGAPAGPGGPEDPYLWLEEVHGDRALQWVRERNRASEALLRAQPGFDALREQLREVLDSREQIPYVTRWGPWLYNLWRDAANPRGRWRRTTLEEYRKAQPAWETVLDIDALGRSEGKSWVWAGASGLGPDYRRCLLSLSVGGADATVVREFDLEAKRFVEPAAGGFAVPEAKNRALWLDADTLLIGSDFGAGTLTDSGYPRLIKRWARGQPLAQASTVFEGERGDVAAYAAVDAVPGHQRIVFGRLLDFYRAREWLHEGLALAAKPALTLIDKPEDATLTFWRERVLLQLRSDWRVGGLTHRAGSLLVADAKGYLAGTREFKVLFEPTATRSLSGWAATRRTVLLTVLDNVAGRLEEWQFREGGERGRGGKVSQAGWAKRDVDAPYPGTLSVSTLHDPQLEATPAGDPLDEHYLLNATDFLNPDSLQLARTGSDTRERLKSRPGFFADEGMRVEQRFATSRDGTRVPYFVVWPRGASADGDNPTLLYGYGGFEVSMKPYYSGTLGRAWTAPSPRGGETASSPPRSGEAAGSPHRGGVYVLANIRGGGEFGPAWHQAALKEKRQTSYDDFIAVAEDLVAQRITRPARLAIQGGSNGGLLVAAVMVQRPDLFGAVLCQVPLIDMRRYHRLLAGASWMGEFGDPDDPAQWAAISRYSPYQNVPEGSAKKLPATLVTTSTRDDRVHPGHARKFAARLAERGQPVLYWENLEGGHGGAADNAQRSLMMALEFSFLWHALRGAR